VKWNRVNHGNKDSGINFCLGIAWDNGMISWMGNGSAEMLNGFEMVYPI
jgi:hypothetical protein